uniref:Uncharacterized protein n=1 Tax=Nelumbo nucifera TaxID=4432 RepID=A0A822ZRW3_NELNU|nr:TPA_asm: hypothetical protein HUJ06_002808 [Nelumbo nucifera]
MNNNDNNIQNSDIIQSNMNGGGFAFPPSGFSLFTYPGSFTFEGESEQCASHYIQQQQQPKLIDYDKLSSFLPIDDSGIPPYSGRSERTLQNVQPFSYFSREVLDMKPH